MKLETNRASGPLSVLHSHFPQQLQPITLMLSLTFSPQVHAMQDPGRLSMPEQEIDGCDANLAGIS